MVAGMERVVHFLTVSFPYSNMRWGGGVAGRDLGMRGVPGSAGGVREDGHGARGRGVRQRHRRGPPQRRRHGRTDPPVLPVLRALRVRAPVPRPRMCLSN